MPARVNLQIAASQVKIISEDGGELGIFPIEDALRFVLSRKEDLVEIDSEASPPVCQAIDYGKYRFRLQQAQKTGDTISF